MKQRLSKLALLAVAAAFIVAGFPACSDEEEPDPPAVALESILVKANPTKTTYTVGEDFAPAGLVITEKYNNGTTTDVVYNDENKGDFSFAGFDASKAGDVTVTITYKEKTATFTVSVAANGLDPDKELASIAVKTSPTKTAYTVDDTIDPAGLVITATYTDETTTDVAYSETNKDDFTFDFNSTAANESVTVTVTYKEKTATFTVSVAEKKEEKSLFQTLSAQENNILKEDFAAFTVTPFGAGFGKVGVYGENGVTVADGAISTGAAGKNRKIYVDFGPVKDVVEGCVTLRLTDDSKVGDVQAGKNLLTFYNGDTAVLIIKTGTGDNTIGGTAGTYEIYYKFDLTAKTVSLTVNGKDVLTDSTRVLTADFVSGYTIESHNGGKGIVAADDIAVCATEGDLATYKAQVKTWLATLVANKYTNGYTTNALKVTEAKTEGDNAIDTAADVDKVLEAYGNAITALAQVKNDLAQKKEDACDALTAYLPEGKNYTENQSKKIALAKEAGKTVINDATTPEAVDEALEAAKAKIDAVPDSSTPERTVTIKASDSTLLCEVIAYYKVADVLDEIKGLVKDNAPNKVIKDDKFYNEQACTTVYDTETTLSNDVTLYVELATVYVLTPDMLGTNWTSPGKNAMKDITTDGVKFRAGENVTYEASTASIKLGGSCQKNAKNAIAFTTTGKVTVTVLFFGTNADRNVGYIEGTSANAVSNGSWTANAVAGTEKTKGSTEIVSTTFSIPKAGTYTLGAVNGLNITKITVVVEE